MLKKLISYTIIFSIVFADIAHCGGIWGKEDREDDVPSSAITKRQTTDFSDNAAGESTEDTRLLPAGDRTSDPFSSELPTPSGSFDFQAFSENPLEKRFSGWEKSHPRSSDEEEQKVGGLTLLETSDEEGGSEVAIQTEEEQNANEEKEAEPTNSHSEKVLNLLRQGGELRAFSINEDEDLENPTFPPEQVVAEVKNWLKNKNPDYIAIILTLSSLGDHHVSSHTKKCLNYIQERIVEGKLNKKQMASILLGLGVGVGVVVMTGIELLGVLAANFALYGELVGYFINNNIDIDSFNDSIVVISSGTLAIGATSRITSFFSHFMRDNTHAFSIQKTKNHHRALLVSKAFLFGISSVVSVVPAYYLSSLITYKCADPEQCSPWFLLVEILFGAIVLDKMTHYGHHFSHHAKHGINRYFFHKAKEGLDTLETATKRQRYLREFKELKRIIYGLAGEELSDLYGDIFNKKVNITEGKSDKEKEEINVKEALRTLRIFKDFHRVHSPDIVPEAEEHWKTTRALWSGWGMTLLATIGRHLAFWYAFDEILEDMEDKKWISDLARFALSIVGGVVAGVIQGAIEIDAIKETVYDILRGKKIPHGSSHSPLRVGIKVWNWFSGSVSSLPYLVAGFNALQIFEPDYTKVYPLRWPLWAKVTCFIPFGITGIASVVSSLHESSFAILNGFDSLMSYCYPFQGYKRDKLVSMARQLRKLFKELHPDVLETVDQLLNPNSSQQQENEVPSPLLEEEFM